MADLHTADPATPLDVETRPWGWFAVLGEPDHDPIAAVKVLHVEPGEMLSLQTHEHRRERWLPVTSGLGAIIGDQEYVLQVGHLYDIGVGVPHRLFDVGGSGGTVVETMYGTYDESDILRLEDRYHR